MPKFPIRLPIRSQAAVRAIEAALGLFRREGPKTALKMERRASGAAEAIARRAPDAVEASLRAVGRSRKTQVAPAVLLVTGAGVAFWWWTQWARGRAESDAAAERDKDA